VDEFLRGQGRNVPFADGLEATPHWFAGLVVLPLGELVRICGPERGMPYREPISSWRARVAQMSVALRAGWRPPPLICEAERLLINDGNHRAEALRLAGADAYPAILWASSQSALRTRLGSTGTAAARPPRVRACGRAGPTR
jgi:hypothetical protein